MDKKYEGLFKNINMKNEKNYYVLRLVTSTFKLFSPNNSEPNAFISKSWMSLKGTKSYTYCYCGKLNAQK